MEKTACKDCKHLILEVQDDGWGSPIWYQMTCRAYVLPGPFDPFSGTTTPIRYGYCRDVNKGFCSKFESLDKTSKDEL